MNARLEAQVLVAPRAEPAAAARAAQPGDADPFAHGEPGGARSERGRRADDLVAGHDVAAVRRQVALGEVQVGAAHAAGGDPHAHLAGPGLGTGRSTHRNGCELMRPGCATAHACIIRTGATSLGAGGPAASPAARYAPEVTRRRPSPLTVGTRDGPRSPAPDRRRRTARGPATSRGL